MLSMHMVEAMPHRTSHKHLRCSIRLGGKTALARHCCAYLRAEYAWLGRSMCNRLGRWLGCIMKPLTLNPNPKCRDEARRRYYRQVRGYIRARVQPAIEAMRDAPDGIPQHLLKVCCKRSI